MPVDRIVNNFDIDTSEKSIIVFGGYNEKFVLPSFRVVNQTELLYMFLKQNGYEHILFLETFDGNGLFAYDEKSFNLYGLGNDESEEETELSGWNTESDVFDSGTIETNKDIETRKIEHTPTVINNTKYGNIFRTEFTQHSALHALRVAVINNSHKIAIIIDNFGNLFAANDELLAGHRQVLDTIMTNLDGDKGKIFLLFSGGDEQIIVNDIHTSGYHALRECYKLVENIPKLNNRNRLSIGKPEIDEIKRLVHITRLKRKLDVDWISVYTIIDEMHYQNKRIEEWTKHLNKQVFKRFDVENFKEVLKIDIRINRETGWQKLEKVIGLKEVKELIRDNVEMVKGMREDGYEVDQMPGLHLALTGNTGTGKTYVSEIIAQIYREEGLLSGSKYTKVKANDLIVKEVGGTAEKTDAKCKEALGGVLFIDEAYLLANNQFGDDAIGILIDYMTERPFDIAIIMAGYKNQIAKLFEVNEGLENRIEEVPFGDYTIDELMQIFDMKMRKEKFEVDYEARQIVRVKVIQGMKKPKKFGNARGIEKKIIDKLRRIAYKNRKKPNA